MYVCASNSYLGVANVYLRAAAVWIHKVALKSPRPSGAALLWIFYSWKSLISPQKMEPAFASSKATSGPTSSLKNGTVGFCKPCFSSLGFLRWHWCSREALLSQQWLFYPRTALLIQWWPFCPKNSIFAPKPTFWTQYQHFSPKKSLLEGDFAPPFQ